MLQFNNPYHRLNNMYTIIDKNANSVIFNMKNIQKEVWNNYLAYDKLIILKGRQMGITTEFCMIDLDRALWLPNQEIVITAHDRQTMTNVFSKIKYAYNKLPDRFKFGEMIIDKPVAKYDTKNEFYFPSNNSRISVSLHGRGGTISSLHITEFAFRRDAREFLNDILPSVPKGAKITLETTANGKTGVGREFFELWKKSQLNNYGFYPLFLGWFDDPGYELDCPELFKFSQELESKRSYLSKYDKKQQDNKLYWYFVNQSTSNLDMEQEYPFNDNEAFISSGQAIFKDEKLKELGKIELYHEEDSEYKGLYFYRSPKEVKNVIVGIDTSEGVLKGDYSAIVGRDENYSLVFAYYAKADSETIFNVLEKIDNMGYSGTFVPEINNMSGGDLMRLLKSHVFENFYIYVREQTQDSLNLQKSYKMGFHTNASTRKSIIDCWIRLIDNNLMDEFDKRHLIEEMGNLIKNDKGKQEADKGSHDDFTIADCICCYVLYNGLYI